MVRRCKFLIFSSLVTAVACSQSGHQASLSSMTDKYAPVVPTSGVAANPGGTLTKTSTNNLRVSLTDAPNKDIKEVVVNVEHMELFLKKGSVEKRVFIGKNTGAIDLLKLQNGVILPLQDLSIPEGVAIGQIRLILNGTGNYVVKSNGDICHLQTPSAQKSGVKILVKTPIVFEKDMTYAMVVDFDAKKSIVVKGNGGCLLKPVLKLLQVTKKPLPTTDSSNGGVVVADPSHPYPTTGGGTETPVTDGSDSNGNTEATDNGNDPSTDPGGSGYDTTNPDEYPDPIDVIDIGNMF